VATNKESNRIIGADSLKEAGELSEAPISEDPHRALKSSLNGLSAGTKEALPVIQWEHLSLGRSSRSSFSQIDVYR